VAGAPPLWLGDIALRSGPDETQSQFCDRVSRVPGVNSLPGRAATREDAPGHTCPDTESTVTRPAA
jgi:hypothetical protein